MRSSISVKKKSNSSMLDLPYEIIVSILSAHEILTAVDIFNVLVGVPELEEICFDRKVLESMGIVDYEELLSIINRSTTEAQHRWYTDPRVQKKCMRWKPSSDMSRVLAALLLKERGFKISNGTKS